MARLAGVDLPRNKRMEIALTYIYGIGRALVARDPEGRRGVARQAHRRSRRQRDPPHPRGRSKQRQLKVEGDLRREVSHEHQAPHGPRLLPRPAPPQEPAGSRPADAHQRAYAQGPAQGPGDQAQERKGRALKPWPESSMARLQPRTSRKSKAKKVKKNIQSGIAHITASFNNTIVTITDVSGQRGGLVVVRREGLQGLAQVDAVRRAARRRGRRPQGDGARHALAVACSCKGPGSGRESALRALAVDRLQDHADPRSHPHPPQRLPAAQAAPRLTFVPDFRAKHRSRHLRTWRITPDLFAASAGAKT